MSPGCGGAGNGGPLVLKFGGAALATPARIRRAARRVEAWARRGCRPVAVVSACGGTTDRILRWIDAVTAPEGGAAERETDRALATGEDLAASLLAAALRARGMSAVALRGGEAGLQATGPWGRGRLTTVDPLPLGTLLDEGSTPVVAGFQAAAPDGGIVTLGRGASDLSAVRIAAALAAAECHLVKDVPGVYDRDPRLHTGARLLPDLVPAELERLVDGNRGIVQADAVRAARALGVRLRIYGYRSPAFGAHGTTVAADAADLTSRTAAPPSPPRRPRSRPPCGG